LLVSINKDQVEVIITLNEMSEYISTDAKTEIMGNFYQIIFHQDPMQPSHPENNGSQYEVVNKCYNGEIINEVLSFIYVNDPVIFENYAQDNDLAFLNIIPCTYYEEYNLSHAILTSELEWDPYIWYHDFEPDSQWSEISFIDTEFDDAGDHTNGNVDGDTLSHFILTFEVEYIYWFLLLSSCLLYLSVSGNHFLS
jgi:hypothetical protein